MNPYRSISAILGVILGLACMAIAGAVSVSPASSAVNASAAPPSGPSICPSQPDEQFAMHTLVSRVRNSVTNFPERGARLARRDDRE